MAERQRRFREALGIRSTGTPESGEQRAAEQHNRRCRIEWRRLLQAGADLCSSEYSILNNSTTGSGAHGGGIYSVGGSVTIVNSTIDGTVLQQPAAWEVVSSSRELR